MVHVGVAHIRVYARELWEGGPTVTRLSPFPQGTTPVSQPQVPRVRSRERRDTGARRRSSGQDPGDDDPPGELAGALAQLDAALAGLWATIGRDARARLEVLR